MGLAVPAMPQREGFIGLSVWGYEGLGRTRAPSHRSLTVVLNLTPAATHRSTEEQPYLFCSVGYGNALAPARCDERVLRAQHRGVGVEFNRDQ